MNKYIKYAFGYLALIPLWTIAATLMSIASDLAVYAGLSVAVLIVFYAIWLSAKLVNQIKADLELHDIASKL